MLLNLPERSKPVIKWAGGKSSLLTQFEGYFPQNCNRYLEPFLGSGAVFLALDHKVPAIINDSNQELFNLYSVLKSNTNELICKLEELKENYSEDFYYRLRSENPKNNIEQAARTIFLNKCGFNGLYRQNSKGIFNVPFGKRNKCPQLYEADNLQSVAKRLQKATLLAKDYTEILLMAKAGDFIYCDPPYQPLSKTASFNSYQAGGFSELEQMKLADACFEAAQKGATVAISNSASKLIYELYKGANINIISAKRAINCKGDRRAAINELLILLHK